MLCTCNATTDIVHQKKQQLSTPDYTLITIYLKNSFQEEYKYLYIYIKVINTYTTSSSTFESLIHLSPSMVKTCTQSDSLMPDDDTVIGTGICFVETKLVTKLVLCRTKLEHPVTKLYCNCTGSTVFPAASGKQTLAV